MDQKPKKIVNPSPSAKTGKTDWNQLWAGAKFAYDSAGMDRHRAILENFGNQKEEICRVLNIVSQADLVRLRRQIAERVNQTKGK